MNGKVNYICSVKRCFNDILRYLVLCVVTLAACSSWGQAMPPDKVVAHIESLPRQEALAKMSALLDDANAAGRKTYKSLLASYEEMLSEPTWESHNEELFATLIEHAATASCLSENDRLRPRLLLEVVRKNAAGSVAHEIDYETLNGEHRKLSEIATPYTLIYFNDPECLSCAKVKERLDTCTSLKQMVECGNLTVLGIYPYDNTEEWHLEPFPSYIVNGRDYKQEVDGKQTYDLMTMPVFYLLDSEKRVIVKNEASLNRVLKVLARLKGMENSEIDAKLNAAWPK